MVAIVYITEITVTPVYLSYFLLSTDVAIVTAITMVAIIYIIVVSFNVFFNIKTVEQVLDHI